MIIDQSSLPDGISLRPSGEADREFSAQLFATAAAAQFSSLGLAEEQLRPMLDQQFEIRQRQWQEHYPRAHWSIVLDGETPIGEWCVSPGEDRLTLVNIALADAARGRGIAAAMVRQLCAEASATDRFVEAHVIRGSAAESVWLHLGFRPVADLDPYARIEWRG